MEATCKTCNHWEASAPAVQTKDNFGECEVLSESGMKYVLPVVQNQSATANIITSGDFGCNQYAG
ncbi:MAG: hypothetical protein AAFZ52_04335 [Bacteroidota bacterium]